MLIYSDSIIFDRGSIPETGFLQRNGRNLAAPCPYTTKPGNTLTPAPYGIDLAGNLFAAQDNNIACNNAWINK